MKVQLAARFSADELRPIVATMLSKGVGVTPTTLLRFAVTFAAESLRGIANDTATPASRSDADDVLIRLGFDLVKDKARSAAAELAAERAEAEQTINQLLED